MHPLSDALMQGKWVKTKFSFCVNFCYKGKWYLHRVIIQKVCKKYAKISILVYKSNAFIAKLKETFDDIAERPAYIPGPEVNIATDYKAVSQSSQDSNYRPASLAVDGNVKAISHTAQSPNQWWMLEFCQPVTIARVKIWNRSDCCGLYFIMIIW